MEENIRKEVLTKINDCLSTDVGLDDFSNSMFTELMEIFFVRIYFYDTYSIDEQFRNFNSLYFNRESGFDMNDFWCIIDEVGYSIEDYIKLVYEEYTSLFKEIPDIKTSQIITLFEAILEFATSSDNCRKLFTIDEVSLYYDDKTMSQLFMEIIKAYLLISKDNTLDNKQYVFFQYLHDNDILYNEDAKIVIYSKLWNALEQKIN
jgi:hypothetical protein